MAKKRDYDNQSDIEKIKSQWTKLTGLQRISTPKLSCLALARGQLKFTYSLGVGAENAAELVGALPPTNTHIQPCASGHRVCSDRPR